MQGGKNLTHDILNHCAQHGGAERCKIPGGGGNGKVMFDLVEADGSGEEVYKQIAAGMYGQRRKDGRQALLGVLFRRRGRECAAQGDEVTAFVLFSCFFSLRKKTLRAHANFENARRITLSLGMTGIRIAFSKDAAGGRASGTAGCGSRRTTSRYLES